MDPLSLQVLVFGKISTPLLYTNNKLTPAAGFTPPPGASAKYDILPVSVGTDPNLAMNTRRGTGFKPFDATTFAVKGYPFGLSLSPEDRKALIAFLKTL